MALPFTPEAFVDVFARYHQAVGPAAPALLTALAMLAIALAWRDAPARGRAVSLILAALWAWTGLAYHLAFFSAINPAAPCAWEGGVRGRLRFDARRDGRSLVAGALLGYALVAYPLLGAWAGHRWPAAPSFGLPCPTTICTIGLLGLARGAVPRLVLVGPVLWAVAP